MPEPEIGPADLEEQDLPFPTLNLQTDQEPEQREIVERSHPTYRQTEGSWMSSPSGLTPEELRSRLDDQMPIARRIGEVVVEGFFGEPPMRATVPTEQEDGAMTNRSDWSQASN